MNTYVYTETDRFIQTVQSKIRLLLQEQSDQGQHRLLFQIHFWTCYNTVQRNLSIFRKIMEIVIEIPKFLNFYS